MTTYHEKRAATVYRFQDKAAIAIASNGGYLSDTQYLTPALARKIGRALIDCAKAIDSGTPFSACTLKPKNLED